MKCIADRPAAQRILDALESGADTIDGICETSGLSINTVRKVIGGLRNNHQVHIAEWVLESDGRRRALWNLGNQVDAPRKIGRALKATAMVSRLTAGYRAEPMNPFRTLIAQVAEDAR